MHSNGNEFPSSHMDACYVHFYVTSCKTDIMARTVVCLLDSLEGHKHLHINLFNENIELAGYVPVFGCWVGIK